MSLDRVSGLDVDFTYTVTGTATNGGVDFTLADGTGSIAAGSFAANIPLTVNDDLLDEGPETVIVTLSAPVNAVPGSFSEHTYTINDNDNTPEIAFTSTSSNGDESASPVDLELNLNTVSGQNVECTYTVTGTATGMGIDYILADGTTGISAGSTT